MGETNITDLTKDGSWFIKFYAPWCGYCVNMKSSWEEASVILKGKVNFAEIDATALSPAFSLNWKIEGFPTLLLVKDNQLYDFMDSSLERTTLNFIHFAENPLVQPKEVPSPLTPLAIMYLYCQMHLQSVLTVYQSKFGAFLVISLFGLLIGILFGLIFLVGKPKPKPIPKNKTE
uniref:Thioredoxin domain-containing protein n=1 Tax=Arcella intermedia TaxID=1963864 RepID=A0A6B2LLV5_9EUKA